MNESLKYFLIRLKAFRLLWPVVALILCMATGLAGNYLYNQSAKKALNIAGFQSDLKQKEYRAEETLNDLKSIILESSTDSLIEYPFEDEDISYYVFEENEMVYWSGNQSDISNITIPASTDGILIKLPNAYCVSRQVKFNSTTILALIIIKNNYPYENNELVNRYARGFEMDKKIEISLGNETDKLAVFNASGKYLFSFTEPALPVHNQVYSVLGFLGYTFAFLIFFLLYARSTAFVGARYFKISTFIFVASVSGVFIGICLYFNMPALLFQNQHFTPFQYASNPLLASIAHLSVASGYFLSTIYLFYFHVRTQNLNPVKARILSQVLFAVYFAFVYYLLSGLVYHSSIQLSILRFKDFSFILIWIHFLILTWGIGLALLFFKSHQGLYTRMLVSKGIATDIILTLLLCMGCFFVQRPDTLRIGAWFAVIWLSFYLPIFIPKYKNIYAYLTIWIFAYTAFIVYNSLVINEENRFNKYKILAENISVNGNTENDRMAEILLEELDQKILKDRKIKQLVNAADSVSIANAYLNTTYLRGFWNKYEMRLNVAGTRQSNFYNTYNRFITSAGTRIKNTHFYSVSGNENNMSYLGVFPVKTQRADSIMLYMEFYPRRNFKSYSFPNLLIPSSPDIQSQLNIAIAKYEFKKLVYSSGKIDYSISGKWIPHTNSEYFKVLYKDLIHYIYSPGDTSEIVITELQPYDLMTYVLYFAYTFLAFFTVCGLLVWGFLFIRQKRNYRLGFTAKFQYAFISLLIVSFLGIFYVSVNFIQKKYRKEQILNLESKKSYIQKALQDMYYWNQDLNSVNTQNLNFDLQDLSYIYHTDIHVYNNEGILAGSSQPLIFHKSLISNRIAPEPYFSQNANLNQYEHIGKLNYLTGYTDFYNGDYLQIGYIAIPQFFSQDEIQGEIESFLAVIIHIYLIIIVLAILLSLFIGKQLSAPLNMIENKLKEMRLGQRNEKIDYTLNDEIGQLVIQYNRTVDELEESARMLAKSERESAWKSMARQVAHEINNPLTPMKLTIQQLQRTKNMQDEGFDEYFKKSTAMLIEQIDNLSRIAGTFSNFARMPEANFERVDVAARLYSVVQLFDNNYEYVNVKFNGPNEGVFVYADPEQLVQVFNNLLKNALQAIPEKQNGMITINLTKRGGKIVISITDNGIGMDIEVQEKLFVPNFTTKSNGMGLGLAIAKSIIELSGGKITFTTKINKGTTFIVELPNAD